jgi:hypothetical protein
MCIIRCRNKFSYIRTQVSDYSNKKSQMPI